MSEDLNLPASLQRLEITPERSDCTKFKVNNPFSVLHQTDNQPECFLESLSLKSVCPKGNCHCNKNENKEKSLRGIRKVPTGRLRPIVRRLRQIPDRLLRAPMLKLESADPLLTSDRSAAPDVTAIRKNAVAEVEDCDTTRLQGSPRFLLRAPVLRITPPSLSTPLVTKWEQQEGVQHQGGQQSRPAPSMCAMQARNPSPDDTSIEELASYFDLFVHIPKKMSVMAEMMYI